MAASNRNLSSQFWDRWYHADCLGRLELVQQLTGMSDHATAVLTNSYLTDLAGYLEKGSKLRKEGGEQ